MDHGATRVQRLTKKRQHTTESEQFEHGLEIRREVLGSDYVDANLAGTDEFMMGFQRLLTEWAWATRGAVQVWAGRQEAC
jgi:hypothetical protein